MQLRFLDPDGSHGVVVTNNAETGYSRVTRYERLYSASRIEVTIEGLVVPRLRVLTDDGADLRPRFVVDEDGGVYAIETLTGDADASGRDEVTLYAWEPLTPRVVVPPAMSSHDTFSGEAGSALLHYIGAHLGSGAGSDRQVSDLTLGPDTEEGAAGNWAGRYQDLLEFLEDIGHEGGVGWRAVWDDGEVEFRVVAGDDLTETVVASRATMTIRAEHLTLMKRDRRNVAYVGGQGDGAARTVEVVHLGASVPTGRSRREMWVDARDTDDANVLASRGRQRLEETAPPASVEVEARNLDVGLGDLVTYASRWGFRTPARVVEVMTDWRDSTVPDRTLVLGRPFPAPSDRVTGAEIE